jgi:rubrerythrin
MPQKELGYVELEWTCKRCGTKNPGMKRICSSCGAPIEQDDKFELPEQQALITDKEKLEEAQKGAAIQCPYCHVYNSSGTKTCKQCGGDIEAGLARQAGGVLGAHSTASAPDRPCPYCNQMVKAGAQRCPHCGGGLAAKPASAAPVPAKGQKTPIWLIIAGIVLVLLCCVSATAYFALSSKTSDVTASVTSRQWVYAIEVKEKKPVEKSGWREDVPAQASDVSCQEKLKETSDSPVQGAEEVCGTPYVVDEGSGAGKVVQDCQYRVYADYCKYTVLDWKVVDTVEAQGNDNNPQWPALNLKSGQQQGERTENYIVTFEAEDLKSYSYHPDSLSEYRQYNLDTQWVLAVNTFGKVNEVRRK